MELNMQLFRHLQASQSHQQDGETDEVDDRPQADLSHNMLYAPIALPIIQEEEDFSNALTPPQHVDELPDAHEPTPPQGVSPQHSPMGQQPITTSSQSLPPQPRQEEYVTSAQHLGVEPSFSQDPPSQHVSQQIMSAIGSIPVQPQYMPPYTPLLSFTPPMHIQHSRYQ